MKKVLFVFALYLLSFSAFSQDLIVTHKGDSINCSINKIKKETIYFAFIYHDEIRNTLMPLSNVEIYTYDFYNEAIAPVEKIREITNSFSRFRFSINGGYSYQTAKIGENVPADLKDYVKGLKSGYHFGGDFSYFFSESYGVGLKYISFQTSNNLNNVVFYDDIGNEVIGKLQDDINTSFIGPFYSMRYVHGKKNNALYLNLAIGYLSYKNDVIFLDPFVFKGGSIGFVTEAAYDFTLNNNFAFGFHLTFISGSLSNYDVDDGTQVQNIELNEGELESMNRLDFSIGIKYIIP